MNKNIEVIGMIYKSSQYLNLLHSELTNKYTTTVDGWTVGVRIVANDAESHVLTDLKKLNIPYSIYNDKNPSDYYLNRVYRCWNFCGMSSKYDNICFVNSDMVFSEKWLENLVRQHNGINIPCSRLVESGKLLSGKHAISMDFGRHANNINRLGWNTYSRNKSYAQVHVGGLYMPCIFEKNRFIESGMYPEGNIYADGIGTRNGHVTQSGDEYYFNNILSQKYGMQHVTVYDSMVYHIQEGEKDA
jgi:hypothetical protein